MHISVQFAWVVAMRSARIKTRPFFGVTLCAAIAAFTLSACGNSTLTYTISGPGITLYAVVTSDSTAIAAVKSGFNASSLGQSGVTVTSSDGDQHMGTQHICGYS